MFFRLRGTVGEGGQDSIGCFVPVLVAAKTRFTTGFTETPGSDGAAPAESFRDHLLRPGIETPGRPDPKPESYYGITTDQHLRRWSSRQQNGSYSRHSARDRKMLPKRRGKAERRKDKKAKEKRAHGEKEKEDGKARGKEGRDGNGIHRVQSAGVHGIGRQNVHTRGSCVYTARANTYRNTAARARRCWRQRRREKGREREMGRAKRREGKGGRCNRDPSKRPRSQFSAKSATSKTNPGHIIVSSLVVGVYVKRRRYREGRGWRRR